MLSKPGRSKNRQGSPMPSSTYLLQESVTLFPTTTIHQLFHESLKILITLRDHRISAQSVREDVGRDEWQTVVTIKKPTCSSWHYPNLDDLVVTVWFTLRPTFPSCKLMKLEKVYGYTRLALYGHWNDTSPSIWKDSKFILEITATKHFYSEHWY